MSEDLAGLVLTNIKDTLIETYIKLLNLEDQEIKREHYITLGIIYQYSGIIRYKSMRMMAIADKQKTIGLLVHDLCENIDNLNKVSLVLCNYYNGVAFNRSLKIRISKCIHKLEHVVDELKKLIEGG